MKPTADGGIFWTGYTYDTAGGVDYPTCTNVRRPNVAAGKLDANGDYVWAKFYCNAAIQPPVNCLSSDEKYLIVGPGVKDANNQYIIDMFVAGTDCQGNIQWQGQWGSSKGDGTATAIPTSDGGFLAVGGSYGSDGDIPYHYTSNPPNLQLTDIIVLKADSLHNKQWVTVIGSSKQDGSRHVFQVGDFYYVIANTDPGGVDHDFANTAPYGPGSTTCFLVKLDSLGNKLWVRSLGILTVNDAIFDESDSTFMVVSATGAGYPPIYSTESNSNYGLAKINLEGQVLWAKNYGLDGVEEIPTGLCKSLNNTYLIVGEVPGLTSPPPPKIGRTDGWILWVDGTGNEIANKFFGTTLDDHPSGVKQLNANKYIISTDAVYLNPAFTQGSWQYNTGVVNGEAFTIIKLTSTNVKEIKSGKNSLQIYPNPANNELTILLPTENTSYSLYISNSEGKIVAQHNKLKQKQLVISTTAWQAGTYLLNCTDKVGNIWNAKAIITH